MYRLLILPIALMLQDLVALSPEAQALRVITSLDPRLPFCQNLELPAMRAHGLVQPWGLMIASHASMIQSAFLQSLTKLYSLGSEPPYSFKKLS